MRKIKSRAESGIRTRDPQLGKLMLYQLSYCRLSKYFCLYKQNFSQSGDKDKYFFEKYNYEISKILYFCFPLEK